MIKKRLLLIGIGVLVCALLVVGILLIQKIDPIEEPPEEDLDFGLTITDEGIKVYHFTPVSVDYMEVKNTVDTYRVRMEGKNVYIVDFEMIPLLSASASGLFYSVETLALETIVDPDCQNMSRFGLDKPQATITIKAHSGAEVTFHIGNETLTEDYYYMSVAGETTVYLIDDMLAERYLMSIREYCDPKIYKTFVPLDDFQALKINSPVYPSYQIRRTTEEEQKTDAMLFSGVVMTSPFRWGVDTGCIESVMATMVALIADEVVQVCVTDADLPQYGLDAASRTELVLSVYADPNPTTYNNGVNTYYDSTKPTGVYENFDVTYYIGKTVDHTVYVMFEDRPVVYAISDEVFSWLEWTPYRYCSKMLFAEYLQDLADLSVTIPNDGTYSFTITGAESSDRDDLRVTCNGISLDGQSFRTYYSNLIGMYPTGEASMPENAGAPVFEINYKTKNGSSHSLKFYSINDRNCAVNIDGETHLSVRITEVEKAINNLHKLLKGQSIT